MRVSRYATNQTTRFLYTAKIIQRSSTARLAIFIAWIQIILHWSIPEKLNTFDFDFSPSHRSMQILTIPNYSINRRFFPSMQLSKNDSL